MVDHSVEYAKQALRDGEIIVFPTETAYGIAADARNHRAVKKVYEAKQRPRSKGLTSICSSLQQARRFSKMTEKEIKIASKMMPGPLTLVVDRSDGLADSLNQKFAFRISSSSLARSIASDFPITATSANISGEETSYAVTDISEELLNEVEAVIDRGRLDKMPTSTVMECVEGDIEIHREGPITLSEVEEAINE